MRKTASLSPATGWCRTTFFPAGLILLLLLVLESSCSSNLFYLPRNYSSPHYFRLLQDPKIVHIRYDLEDKRQTAFYLGSAEGSRQPKQLWVLFGGIGSLALDWHQWFHSIAGNDIGFLLIDYPGYGLNDGVPRQERMVESGIIATTALLELFGTTRASAPFQLNVMGHSLGSGVAIHFADRMVVDRLLLIAPFTTMGELVQYRYGWFRGLLITLINPERYLNSKTLAGLVRRASPPKIDIVHGEEDTVIPVEMGVQLAKTAGNVAALHIIPQMGHRNMFAEQDDLIIDIIAGTR